MISLCQSQVLLEKEKELHQLGHNYVQGIDFFAFKPWILQMVGILVPIYLSFCYVCYKRLMWMNCLHRHSLLIQKRNTLGAKIIDYRQLLMFLTAIDKEDF